MTTTGEIFGPYLLEECLGKGGFGAVYAATHQETGQRVAIKFLHNTAEMEPDTQQRFIREVTLLERFDHENIVGMLDTGLHEGKIYCAMELVECGSLKEVLTERHQLPWRESAEVAQQVCHALAHAHKQDCIHRDLKPSNLYLAEDGLVKLGDLGLARDLTDSRLTANGLTVGTWRYMPPEQITGQEDIDGRLDLYALGCILFEMVAGRVPFEGADMITVFDQHMESVPARLDVLIADCPPVLADLVDRLLEKKPADRPGNASIVAEQLAGILSGELTLIGKTSKSTDPTISKSDLNLTQRLQCPTTVGKKIPLCRVLVILAAAAILVAAIVLATRS